MTLTATLEPLATSQGFDLTPLRTAEMRWDAAWQALRDKDFDLFDRIMGFKEQGK